MQVSTKRNQRSLDDESQAMLFEGLNQSQIATAFQIDLRTVQRKIHGVQPAGIRNGSKVWRIRDIAPYFVKPHGDMETYLKRMNHADLPKQLTKEFWAGQRARQEFLLREGDLWPTTEVVSKVGELMKIFAMSLKLMADTVDRQAELTPKQRQIITEIVDSTQRDLAKTVTKHFSKKPDEKAVPDVQPDPLNDDEDDEAL